jgi:hypothetical protein
MVTRPTRPDECRYYGGAWNRPADVFRTFGVAAPRKARLVYAYRVSPPFEAGEVVVFEDAEGALHEVIASARHDRSWRPAPTSAESIFHRLVHSDDFDFMEEEGVLSLLDALDSYQKRGAVA